MHDALTVILIGPIGAGKSTIGRLLAKKLDVPLCSVDRVRGAYYARVGYDQELASKIAASARGFRGVMEYSKPFEARMVENVLAEHHGVIDFGASNSVYDDEELLTQVETALKPYQNVILLLPSSDQDESAEILKNRLVSLLRDEGMEFTDELFGLNHYFITHPSNYRLAKLVIHTKEKTPEMICDEIIRKLG